MNIVKPWVEIRKFDGVQIMKNLELAAKQCYRSQDNITDESYKKFLSGCISRGHASILEHEKISIRLKCDIGCYDKDTKVLTKSGWKYIKDINTDDIVYTLDDDNNVIEVNVRGIVKKQYKGKMYHFISKQIDLLVTPDHNMWIFDEHKRSSKTRIWKFLKAQELTNRCYKFSKQANNIFTHNNNPFILPEIIVGNNARKFSELRLDSELLYELFGWWITDGNLEKSNKCDNGITINITQVKQKNRNRIEYLLKQLNINYSVYKSRYRISCPQLAHFIYDNFYSDNNTNKSFTMFVPDFIRNSDTNLIEAFLRGAVGGNGCRYENGKLIIYTASKTFAEDLVELFFKVGKTANYYENQNLNKYNNGKTFKQTKPNYTVSVCRTQITYYDRAYKNNYTEQLYDDMVYCLVLDNYHRLFIMRNGKTVWCGNCYKDLTRHRHASFSVESTRYCSYNKGKFDGEISYIEPCNIEKDTEAYEMWYNCMENIEKTYMNMAKINCYPDQLRMVLPHSTAAELCMTANIREWRHILSLRAEKYAHPSVQQVMIPLLRYFQKEMPELFNDIEYNKEFDENKYAELRIID